MSELDTHEWQSCRVYGTDKLSCYDCNFEVLRKVYEAPATCESLMRAHCQRNNHGVVPHGKMTIDQYIDVQAPLPPRGVIITLGYLCWNTAKASEEGVIALAKEADRLRRLGCEAHVLVVDNGSSDGTARRIESSFDHPVLNFELIKNVRNFGISVGRNQLIDGAVERKSDYLCLMDGDIEIVPLSSYVMVRYLECHSRLGCIGAYSSSFTSERLKATKSLMEIQECRVKDDIKCAWTQYGMFRCSMFKGGLIRFDESGPFGEPGWGFEDDDLHWQMDAKGWENKYFAGITYLHRNIRSSFPNLQASGVDVQVMFNKRKEYLIKKWSQRGVSSDTLRTIQAQTLPAA